MFTGHIMRVRFPTGTEQSILSSCCIVNLVVYWNDTWIEGIHIFNSLLSNSLWVYGWRLCYEHCNIWLVILDSISVYIEPSPVSPERSPGSSIKRCPAKLVDGRVVRWSWVNFQGWEVLLIWIIVWQGPIALAVGAGGGCLDILTLLYLFTIDRNSVSKGRSTQNNQPTC